MVIFNRDGSVTRISNPTPEQTAIAQGQNAVSATVNVTAELATDAVTSGALTQSNATIGTSITTRQLLPLPCLGGLSCGENRSLPRLTQGASAADMLDAIEIGAALLGQAPVIGEPIDLFVGGGVSLLRGDHEGAMLSALSAIPGPVGNVAGATKIARKVKKGADVVDSVGDTAKGSKQAINNAERMKQGKPPIGNDGYPMELHHKGQNPNGKLVPMTRTEHRGKGNYKKNHPNRGSSKIDRKEAAKARRKFWKRMAR